MAEKEYIERGALIRYVEKQEVIIKDGLSIADAVRIQGNVFRRAVETCPAADVVEVVRCKDCAYANENGTTCHYGVGHYTSPMRYCSEGERKDGADNE